MFIWYNDYLKISNLDFEDFLGFFLEIPLSDFLADLHTTDIAYINDSDQIGDIFLAKFCQ